MTVPDLDALFLDFDGVLCDSVDVKTDAFAALYEHEGPAVVEQVKAYHLAHGGVSRFEKIRHYERALLGREAEEDHVAELAERFAVLVVDAVVAAPEIPGASALLRRLEDHIPMHVVSGTPEQELREIVERRGWNCFFRSVRGSPATKSELLETLIAVGELDRRRCCMIGDATTDEHAARECGIPFLGVADRRGKHPFPDTSLVVADLRDCSAAITRAIEAGPCCRSD